MQYPYSELKNFLEFFLSEKFENYILYFDGEVLLKKANENSELSVVYQDNKCLLWADGKDKNADKALASLFSFLKSIYVKDKEDETVSYAILANLQNVFTTNISNSFIFAYIVDQVIKSVNAEVGILEIYGPNLEVVETSSMGLKSENINFIFYKGKPIREFLKEIKNMFVVQNVITDDNIIVGSRENGVINSLIAIPVEIRDTFSAAIFLVNKNSNDRLFTNADIHNLNSVAPMITSIIRNALLYREVNNLKNYNDSILRNLPIGILGIDVNKRLMFKNQFIKNLIKLNKIDEKQLVDTLYTHIKETDFINKEITLYTKNKNKMYLQISKKYAVTSDSTAFSLFTIMDITNQKEMEIRLRKAEKLAVAGELVSGLAHEIKNPLTSIKGFADILPLRINDKEFIEKFGKIVSEETNRLNQILDNFLNFARPEIHSKHYFCIKILVEEVCELLSYQLKKHDIKIFNNIMQKIKIFANRNLIFQVITNVTLNSINALQESDKKEKYIKYEVDNNTDEIIISIEDNGIGMTPEVLNEAINPFFTTKTKGSGLGLSISYRIINEHGGKMEIESEYGKGTVVKILLPQNSKSEKQNG